MTTTRTAILHSLVAQFNDGDICKFTFYPATMNYTVAEIAAASGISPDVIRDRRRYMKALMGGMKAGERAVPIR